MELKRSDKVTPFTKIKSDTKFNVKITKIGVEE